MNIKYILALFLTAAFFMSGCTTKDTSDAMDDAALYDNTGIDYYGRGTDYYGTASYGTTGDGVLDPGESYTGQGYGSGRTDSNALNGTTGRNSTVTNSANGMASSRTTGTNY